MFVVQASKLPVARKELHSLLENRELNRKPLLILANKLDIAKFKEPELIKGTPFFVLLSLP